jgi:hypothetical protein
MLARLRRAVARWANAYAEGVPPHLHWPWAGF